MSQKSTQKNSKSGKVREVRERCINCKYWHPTGEIIGVCTKDEKPITKLANQRCSEGVFS